jgi:uncharacterized protein YceK
MMREAMAAALAALLFVSGCGTFASLQSDCDVYGGVRRDAEVAADFMATRREPPKQDSVDVRTVAGVFGMAAIMDMPMSAAADTLLLPVTVPVALLTSN